jgi:hypothetical protein
MIKVTNDKSNQRSVVVAGVKDDHVVLEHLELVCGRNLENFGDSRSRAQGTVLVGAQKIRMPT